MKKTLLKGGSLAGTYLVECVGERFVRKEIHLNENREYGYQRWYSQMKRIQRYNSLFPGLFPELLRHGMDGCVAFFDLEYLNDSVNCHNYISSLDNETQVKKVFDRIVQEMSRIHSMTMSSSEDALLLYIEEEVSKKLNDCMVHEEFRQFCSGSIVFNGVEVRSIKSVMEEYIRFGIDNYKHPVECFTHGNITLENMMYSVQEDRIYFIDPYDENIIDNIYNEYSQIMQSSNSHYEIYNSSKAVVDGNCVTCEIEVPFGISCFNDMFVSFMKSTFTQEEINITKFFEISQYMRMLPFKMHSGNIDKMFLFYAIGSSLYENTLEYNN